MSKVGRPTKFKEEYCEMLEKHLEEGLSFEAFAGVLGVCKQTLYEWEDNFPQFLDAKKRAWEKCRLFWEKKGLEGLFNEEQVIDEGRTRTTTKKSMNSTVWIFNMKNRFGWRDRQEIEEKSTKEIKITIDKEDADL